MILHVSLGKRLSVLEDIPPQKIQTIPIPIRVLLLFVSTKIRIHKSEI